MKALKIHNLYKTYKSGLKAVQGIDLVVEQGDFFALLGPNGAGKTTTIGIITSLVTKTSGHVSVFGYDIEQNWVEAKACIGLVPQELNFNQFETVFDIVVNQAGFYGLPRSLAIKNAEHYLKKLDLWDKRNVVSRTLSGGMKRRLMIARALVHEPKMLILDEPTAGVDIELRRSMWAFLQEINKKGITIILTTHYLEEAEYLCKEIGIIDHGKLIERTSMKNLLSQLNTETIVLDLDRAIFDVPVLEGFKIKQTDESSLEVSFCKQQGLNSLFKVLTDANITVISMRNKANRLEELFIGLIQGQSKSLDKSGN